MIHYFKLFLRKLLREKIFSAINIIGLSLGIACSLLIYLYVASELSHDQFHTKADRIYRINQTFIWGDDTRQQFSSTGPGVSLAIREEIPEADLITRVHTPGDYIVTRDQGSNIISFDEDQVLATDSNFLEVFTFPLKLGDDKTALHKPHSILLTQDAASRYFPGEDPIGKMIQLGQGGESTNYQVTGVFDQIPENSYIAFDFLISMSSFPRVERQSWSWIWTTFETYVVLNENANVEKVEKKLLAVPAKHAESTLQRIMGTTFEDYVKSGKEWKLYLQPYTAIHLGSANVLNRLNTTGNKTVVNVLSVVGVFILLLSCINYINLKTSQTTRYARDTSVRKLMGSSKSRIGMQYMVESLLFLAISVSLGVLLAFIALPYFNDVSGTGIDPSAMLIPSLLGKLTILTLIMSLVCGSYPAMLLSTFKPIDLLSGKVSTGRKAKSIRNVFVVVQFAISIGLIAATAIVYEQLQYTFNKDVGFQKENLLTINHVEWIKSNKSFTAELANIPGVINASLGTSVPPRIYNGDQFLPEEDQNKNIALNYTQVDDNYIPTLGLQLLYGMNFSNSPEQEKYHVIINESAVEALGWQVNEDVLHKRIVYPGNNKPFTIIGIVKDFSYWNVQAIIEPLALFHIDNPVMGFYGRYAVAVRMENKGISSTIDRIQAKWKALDPGIAFSYEFTDQAFAADFQSTVQFRKSLSVFAGLALLIAGLGLLGMIIYVVEQRTKEIGIRKVLGSNTFQVVTLMSKRFVFQVLLALVLSMPFTYWAMTQWLSDFEYHITISPLIFMFAGVIAIVFAFSIVGFQSFRAALINPSIALRDE